MAKEKQGGPSPLYQSVPFVFKTTGSVRRVVTAPRYSRKLGQQALRLAQELSKVQFLTVADHQTVYVLSREQTKTIQQDVKTIEDMILNGWGVYPTTDDNISMLPQIYQQELL